LHRNPDNQLYCRAYAEQVRMLYDSMAAAVIANIFTSFLFVLAQWFVIEHSVLFWWFGLSVLVIVLRAFLLIAYRNATPSYDEMKRWGNRFVIGSSVSALMLGSASIFLFPDDEPVHQIMCAFILVGMSSGALSSLSYSRHAYPLYLSFVLIPLFISLSLQGTYLSYLLMPMVVLAYVFMLRSGIQISKNSEQNIILRLEAVERENELLQSQQKQDLHIKNTPLGVIEWGGDFRVVAWNPSAERIFGYTAEEAVGQHAKDLILPEYVKDHVDHVWRELLSAEGGFRSTNENITKEGSIIMCDWYNTPLINNLGKVVGVTSLVEDITERKQVEARLILAKEDAEKANQVKSEFLSRMSHELRTPLNAVLGFAQLLELDVEDEKSKDNVQEILSAGSHLLELINEVLDLAKIEAGKFDMIMADINLYEVIDACINMVAAQAESSGIKIITKNNTADNCTIHVDKMRFRQIILNLLSNAIKYNRQNGLVTIECSRQSTDKVRVSISDTGMGLTVEQQHNLFKPFERVGSEKTDIEGTGIGLVITKLLVQKMDGDIGFSSSPGEGSTFWVDVNAGAEN